MTVLGIETATAVCGAAVCRDGVVLAEASETAPQAHSERLLVLIDQALASAGLSVRDLDGIACSIGPGSFTGLRIGLSVAKGLAFAADLPLAAVSTLEALAARAAAEDRVPDGGDVLAAIDARRDEVYAALYKRQNGDLVVVAPPAARSVGELAGKLAPGILVMGDGGAKVRRAAPFLELPPPGAETCRASAVALLGEKRLLSGQREDVASLEPSYVKEFYTTAIPLSQ